MGRSTDRSMQKQSKGKTNRRADGHTVRCTDGQVDRHALEPTNSEIDIHGQMDR